MTEIAATAVVERGAELGADESTVGVTVEDLRLQMSMIVVD
jgi:hypothetical protein